MTPLQRPWAFWRVRREVADVCREALPWVGYPARGESWAGYRTRAISEATLRCSDELWRAGKYEEALDVLRRGRELLRRDAGAGPPDG